MVGQRCMLSLYGERQMKTTARRVAMIAGLVAVIFGAAVALGVFG